MAFGNYYGGVTNEKNILDKLAEMTKELREVKVMLINPEVQAEQIKYQVINEAKAEADKLINEAKAEAEKSEMKQRRKYVRRRQRDKSEDERKKCLDEYLNSRQICYKREVDMDVRQWLENYFAKKNVRLRFMMRCVQIQTLFRQSLLQHWRITSRSLRL